MKSTRHKVLNTLAYIISYVFCAPLFSLYIALLIIFKEPLDMKWHIRLLVSLLTLVVAPTIHIAYARVKGEVDFFVSDKRKRPKFFIAPIIGYIFGAALFHIWGDVLLALYHFCYLVISTTTAFFTIVYAKVSVHMAGITGPITFVVLTIDHRLAPLYLISIPVAWARISTRAHSPREVMLGALVAPLMVLIVLMMAKALGVLS
ncbi:MAG: hypothetical protein DRN15_04280 [Thermoprotei archaeon]|nr:MAG: hypothetical protein DRM97_04830 [Thermoprotei archaeon]RLF24119.1 MAG: hypothetical protein DRN15_04280 [Thermoprotei archaeon]